MHYGIRGDMPVELVVFYAGAAGMEEFQKIRSKGTDSDTTQPPPHDFLAKL